MIRLLVACCLFLPALGIAATATTDTLATPDGALVVHPVEHASFLMQWNGMVVAVDPVGAVEPYLALGRPHLVLVTHKHGDHFDTDVLRELAAQHNVVITTQQVAESVPACDPVALAPGEAHVVGDITVTAVPAYNRSEGRLEFHPPGRDNGYLLDLDGYRVYISGDTEDIPEQAALAPVDVAFLCMNEPWTMTVDQAARAVAALRPGVLYPYHFRNNDGSFADLARLRTLVGEAVEVRELAWY